MCFGNLILLLFMWGLSIKIWKFYGIDYIKLLNLENSESMSSHEPIDKVIIESTANLSIIFLIIFIIYNKAVRFSRNINQLAYAHAIPCFLTLYFIIRIFFESNRKYWLEMIVRVLLAPTYKVIFRDGYIGDILTSLVRIIIPLCFSIVYLIVTLFAWISNNIELAGSSTSNWWDDSFLLQYFLIPFVTLYPLFIRFFQCLRRGVESGDRWPHYGNALKYSSAIVTLSYGTFQPSIRSDINWISLYILVTLFQFVWDITQDWGIITISWSNRQEYRICNLVSVSMKKNRLFGKIWLYYYVILFNFVLRFAWALTLLPNTSGSVVSSGYVYIFIVTHMNPLIATVEIIRRMIWGWLRLEYEQIEQLGKLSMEGDKQLLSLDNTNEFQQVFNYYARIIFT